MEPLSEAHAVWLLVILLLFSRAELLAQQPADKISAVLAEAGGGRRGLWGVQVVNLTTGETVFSRQQDSYFVPASTAKLFTTALALERLGPEHRFSTLAVSAKAPSPNGTLAGDLRLVGGGDPSLSGRVYPYKAGAPAGNAFGALEEIADAIVARGVKRIEGDVVGDDTAYLWDPYPQGRAQEDSLWDYGAPVSALTVNDGRIGLTVRPGRRSGEPARIAFAPALDYFIVDNRVITSEAGGTANVQVSRAEGSRQLRVWGRIPAGGSAEARSLAVDDQARFAASALYDALVRRGVSISGKAVVCHRRAGEQLPPPGAAGFELARHVSPPLADLLTVINKESQNLHAEMLLTEVGRRYGREGSRAAGLEELTRFLGEAGVPSSEVRLVDASGLSMLDMVTPRAMTMLLAHMYRSPRREVWLNSLAVAGEEGTLRQRFREYPEAKTIRAKTGTLSRVSAIGGYAQTPTGETMAFSILVNNYVAPAAEVRSFIDKMCLLLVH
jgi:D-alanyl-D-alanine carboxypeptidase/D-alanyl-D-alanine-endopeptidase (penicillin-binding protein 4)